jgi:hypothetical protein
MIGTTTVVPFPVALPANSSGVRMNARSKPPAPSEDKQFAEKLERAGAAPEGATENAMLRYARGHTLIRIVSFSASREGSVCIGPGRCDHHNRKGLISDRGQRKLAFYTLQKFYGKLADAEK